MKYTAVITSIIAVITLLVACKKDEPKQPTDAKPVLYDPTPYTLNHVGFPAPPISDDNLLTIQGVQLGRMLFYETMLSGNNKQSCGSCHQQQFAFTDTAKYSLGIHGLLSKRNSMSAVNMAWNTGGFFWDGRANLLRTQALMPITDAREMDGNLDTVVGKLSMSNQYREQFMRAFGSEDITANKIGLALEQFMNSIVSNDTKYDKYRRGELVLDSAEERGRQLFFAEYNPSFPELSGADCAHCHSGPNFSNNQYMNNGTKLEAEMMDLGRQSITGNLNDKGKFKVITLRNIALTAPYMSDGNIKNLEEVIDHYNIGLKESTTLDPALRFTKEKGLMLNTQDKADLVAFLKTLTDYTLLSDPKYADPQQ
jgi:cytochrome c peroxidase